MLIVIVWSIKFPGHESRIRRCPLLPPGQDGLGPAVLQCCRLPPVSGALQDRNMLARAASVSALMITSSNVLDENKIILTHKIERYSIFVGKASKAPDIYYHL